jgi:hypothetical protein
MADRRLLAMAIAAGILFSGGAGAEGVYKWVDEKGQVHFGGTPPAGRKSEKHNTPPSTSEPAQAAPASTWQEQLHVSNERRQLARDKEQATAKRQQENEQRCLTAQRALDTLNRERPLYRVNSQGEREYMDDGQRQASRDAANERVATYCRN